MKNKQKKQSKLGKVVSDHIQFITYAQAKNMFMEMATAAANEAAGKKTKTKKK